MHFDELNIRDDLKATLKNSGLEIMTPVQKDVIPAIMNGDDVIVQAKTGSGKTISFVLPVIQKLEPKNKNPKVLVIAPTRELCEQIATVFRGVGACLQNLKIVTLYGGVSLRAQATNMLRGADVVIGTAGRLNDHLFRGTLVLEAIETLILDEADRMLDMGFFDDIMKVIDHIKNKPQTMLFSATYPRNIEKLSSKIMKNPKMINIHSDIAINIEEYLYKVKDKYQALLPILQAYKSASTIIFCNTKTEANNLFDFFNDLHFDIALLHGDFDQKERDEALLLFKNGSLPLLIATDVASRGLDIDDVELVVNFDIPFKSETYTHRIGRTARAGKEGIAVSLFTSREERLASEVLPDLLPLNIDALPVNKKFEIKGTFRTLCIFGGKKDKLRKGDLLGALCKELEFDVKDIGDITITDKSSYVAISKKRIGSDLLKLQKIKIKNRNFRAKFIY
ncbi:MAG: DEAD/DEAH box helicase [Epsilonproteobacteria bacterium]|nr:DEAD/DEAH box helicase [Campylobacterota bacterium]